MLHCERGFAVLVAVRSLPFPSKPFPRRITSKMPKENTKSKNSQHRVCESHSTIWWRGPLMSFQYSPYPTPSASAGPSVLTRSRRIRQPEDKGPPHSRGSLISNPTASVWTEGSSTAEVWRYLCIRELDLKCLYAMNHTKPIAINLENVRSVVPKPSTSTGAGETTQKKRATTATHQVRAHY